MNDREKAIRILEGNYKSFVLRHNGELITVNELLALLKAQEPKPVHVTAKINHRKIGECPNCSKLINSGDYPNYCGHCGQAVKWDA